MTSSELAQRLERSFAVLAGGRRGAVAHHQTLRATIDWSFHLLAEPERHLLCRLAVFATALLEVGASVVQTDPEHARACLRESRELSAALGYQSAPDLVWATGIAFT
jgi:non-specific serine/threonine protein kinase